MNILQLYNLIYFNLRVFIIISDKFIHTLDSTQSFTGEVQKRFFQLHVTFWSGIICGIFLQCIKFSPYLSCQTMSAKLFYLYHTEQVLWFHHKKDLIVNIFGFQNENRWYLPLGNKENQYIICPYLTILIIMWDLINCVE